MSMIHTTHLIDWKLYSSEIGGPSRDPEKAGDWHGATEAIRALCAPKAISRMPAWKKELITNQFPDLEVLLKPTKKETLQDIRDLHFLGILSCLSEEGEGYEKAWDLLKECLRHELGNEVGDDLILGRYWKGSAWDFVPDLLSYQYGLLEGKRLIACHQKLLQLTEEKFVATLQRIDLKENYPSFGARLEPVHVQWILEALRQLNRNLKRAIEKGLPLFYMLD